MSDSIATDRPIGIDSDQAELKAFPDPKRLDVTSNLSRAVAKLESLQHADGSFEGEVVWCPMILAQYVILRSMLKIPFSQDEREHIVQHFRQTRRDDGGWGLHPESPSYVFVTTLGYVALRLLGIAADKTLTSEACRWLHAQRDGVLGIPSWGKFWLAMTGLYDYAGLNPCPPEVFLLPARSLAHPNQLYCHTRYIYLAMSCLYGMRYCCDLGPITKSLRAELYGEADGHINFSAHRNNVAASDLYVAPGRILRWAWTAMSGYERLATKIKALKRLRQRAVEHCLSRIRLEQQASNFQALSPVNGMLNIIALYAHNPTDPLIEASLAGLESWRWDDASNGLRLAGARSTSWDTAFAIQAMLSGPTGGQFPLQQAYAFLDSAQETSELAAGQAEARDPICGGWCFSDGRHRWPVSDCAAEALSAVLDAHAKRELVIAKRIPQSRLEAAVHFILSRQNEDGGFGTYERRRGSRFLERLNPSEMFGDCMTELSYVECTASAIIALCRFQEQYPTALREQLIKAIAAGCKVVRQRQNPDGSWTGFWGVNFTYATWFAVSALVAAGASRDDLALVRAANWLIARQKSDGGWGEHYSSCLSSSYVEHAKSQAVMTSWALLALLEVFGPQNMAVQRGVAWLCRAQRPDGSWPEGAVNGVFFGSAMLTYRLYPMYFPLWALNRYCAASSHAECN